MCEDDLSIRNQSLTDMSLYFDHAPFVAGINQLGGVGQCIAGNCPTVKRHLRNFGQDDHPVELVHFSQQNSAGLSHPFEHQRLGHHWKTRKVIVQMVFGQGDVFNRLGV